MPKRFLKCMPMCENPRNSRFFHFFVIKKLIYEANFPTLNVSRKSKKAQNGLKFLSELCFGNINAAKDSNLLNSKVAFLKSG